MIVEILACASIVLMGLCGFLLGERNQLFNKDKTYRRGFEDGFRSAEQERKVVRVDKWNNVR